MLRMLRPRRLAFALCLLVLFGYEAYVLFFQELGSSSHLPPANELSLTAEVYGPVHLMQTFSVHTDGFDRIEVYPRQSQHPPKGQLRIRVLDGRTNRFVPLVERFLDASTIDLTKPLSIDVPRVDDSAGGLFMLEIILPDAPRGYGVRFEQGGPGHPFGNLTIDSVLAWGDLKFRTSTQRTTIFRNIRHWRRTLPSPLHTDAALVAAFAIGNWALATVFYALAFAEERQTSSANRR